MQASVYLIEIDALDGGSSKVLRFGSAGYVTRPDDVPADTHYPGRIVSAGKIEQHMFDRGRTTGQAYMGLGDVVLGNADGGLDALRDYDFDGRRVRMLRLDDVDSPYATAELVYVATIEALDWSDSDAPRLRFYDRRRLLDNPLLTARYSGTTTAGGQNTANGTPDMAGEIKGKIWGRVLSVEAVIPNPFDVILQFSDGAISAVTLYDGGVLLDYDGNNTSLPSLISNSQNPGHYRAWLNGGMVRPGGSRGGRADFVWIADVTEGATAALRSAGQIVLRMLAHMGLGGEVDTTSFTALNAAAPAEIGIRVDTEVPAISVIRQVLDSIGGYLTVDLQGRFSVGRFTGVGIPSGRIEEREIVGGTFGVQQSGDTASGLPASGLRLQWGRLWRPLSPTEIAHDVTKASPARAEALGREWREVVTVNAGVVATHPLAEEIAFTTYLVNQAEAISEASRRGAFYSVARDVATVTLPRERANAKLLGTSWTVQLDYMDFATGKAMVVIGREADLDAETVTLWLWG